MKFDAFKNYINTFSQPVILLEGTRKISEKDYQKLIMFGSFIAEQIPDCMFRSGNAIGSDDAFATGVRKVADDRIQLVLPTSDSGKTRLKPQDYKVALEEISFAEEQQIIYESNKATPKNKSLFDAYKNKQEGRMLQKSLYLLRDTMKVIGSKEKRLDRITAGLFYVNEGDPESGGTGHTVRVCRQNNIPILTQEIWMNWI